MKMKDERQNIKAALENEVSHIEASSECFYKIRREIYEKEEQENMKKGKFNLKGKRKAVLSMLCVILGSISVLAAVASGGWTGHSKLKYTSFPSVQQVKEDVGFAPKFVESLPGGFEFYSGRTGSSEMIDEKGEVLTTTKDVSFDYKKEGASQNPLSLNIELLDEAYLNTEESEPVALYKGIQLYYYHKPYKFVPVDYVMTVEEQKAVAEGKMEISVGASEISEEDVQGISWYENGMSYLIMGNDYHFEVSEMIEMAEAVINQE